MAQKIRLSQIDYHQPGGGWLFGHGPDKRHANRSIRTSPSRPIHVERRGRRYRMVDGNDRKYWAEQRGDTDTVQPALAVT